MDSNSVKPASFRTGHNGNTVWSPPRKSLSFSLIYDLKNSDVMLLNRSKGLTDEDKGDSYNTWSIVVWIVFIKRWYCCVVLLAVRVGIRVKSRPTSPFKRTILEQVKGWHVRAEWPLKQAFSTAVTRPHFYNWSVHDGPVFLHNFMCSPSQYNDVAKACFWPTQAV